MNIKCSWDGGSVWKERGIEKAGGIGGKVDKGEGKSLRPTVRQIPYTGKKTHKL